jgi:hypothetical protein
MRESLKKLIEEMGGTVVLNGALIQFSEESFERAFRHIFEAGMDHQAHSFKAALEMLEQSDKLSESSGGPHGRH